ncbi:ABC transporter permease [Xylanimonas oleitrophica]|uniref:ABC transporter permease n=1 Tax=Xylanimonas oleitrophica TaxID=2607479 RepID=A0A2W5Y950_9MICO|nr:ABC transporter permease [Xylanimonas oleitrophica]PZR55104.1 ABC transporter permease [Xylanimonas oleitrophica]
MTAQAVDPAPGAPAPDAPVEHRTVETVSSKAPVILAVLTGLLALLLVAAHHPGDVRFALGSSHDFFEIPVIVVPGPVVAWGGVVVMAALTAVAFVLTSALRRHVPAWVTVPFAVVGLVAFLAWAGAGSPRDLSITGLISGAIALSIPIVYGALGGVIGERAGVVNIAIEAQLLLAAFTSALVGSITRSPWAGLVAAMLAGVLVALVLGVFAITYRVNQVIVGVVLNVLVIGITSFLYSQLLVPNAQALNTTPRFPRVGIPLLERIPVIGPAVFNQTVVVYLMFVVTAAVWFGLYRTRWGLRVRAVGEHPKAADTVGIKVNATRYRALLMAGAVAGIGGAFYTVVSIGQFGREMTAGAGFIALAAVIFGKWDPLRAAFAGLLFGFASNLQSILSVVGAPVPSQFMLMLPYVITLLAVAGLVGRSRGPAASGVAYEKE